MWGGGVIVYVIVVLYLGLWDGVYSVAGVVGVIVMVWLMLFELGLFGICVNSFVFDMIEVIDEFFVDVGEVVVIVGWLVSFVSGFVIGEVILLNQGCSLKMV